MNNPAAAFEAVQFVEPDPLSATNGLETVETVLGTFVSEAAAIRVARAAWKEFRSSGRRDVAWWLVRVPGEQLARWIADSASARERVVDLTTGRLIDVP